MMKTENSARTLVYIDVSGPDICVMDVSAQKGERQCTGYRFTEVSARR